MTNFKKYNYTQIFLIISFISCWVSISTNIQDIYNVLKIYKFDQIPTFNEIINCLRQLMIIIIFPFLLILNLLKINKDNLKTNFSFFCLFLYFIFQIPGLIFTQNSLLNLGLIISAMNILLILNLANQLSNKKLLMIFIYVNIFFLTLVIYLNKQSFIGFWTSENTTYLYSYRDIKGENFLGKIGPRSSGSARTFLLIYIIILLAFKNFFNKHQILKYSFYIIVVLLILLFQNRTVTVLLLTFIVFNYFIENNVGVLKYISLYIIVPIFVFYSFVYVKTNFPIQMNTEKVEYESKVKSKKEKRYIRQIDPLTFSSGRVEDWKSLISKFKNEFEFLGFGAQADRFLINQSASNGLLYALTSSGILGTFFYLIFCLSCLVKVFDNLIINYNKRSLEIKLSTLIILLLLMRSILETSFAVFSIDFIVISTFFIFIKNKELLKKNGE